jgi:hypothetical protein
MARRTYEQIFLDQLKYMAGNPPARVSSRALKTALGWGEDRYGYAREGLIRTGLIKAVLGGPGGSLELVRGAAALPNTDDVLPQQKPVQAFVSYSHVDLKLKNELLKHLAPLRRLGIVADWQDGEIKPGDEWPKAIADKLLSSRIVLLLISSDFIASEHCYEKELKVAMQRHVDKEAVVLPVIARPCLWEDMTFGDLQSLPQGGRAITSWENQDEALTSVAKGVREAAQTLLGAAGPTRSA